MDSRVAGPTSIVEVNALPSNLRDELCLRLVPDALLARLGIERVRLDSETADRPVRITAPADGDWVRVEVRQHHDDRDPSLLLDVGMSMFAVPELSFVQIGDLRAPRYAIDRDEDGQETLLGTVGRNEAEERRAMAAGLAPGQVRRGLGLLGAVLDCMDDFCRLLGREVYLLEPLFYHSAVLYERRGCGYFIGRERMDDIHARFLPGEDLYRRLDDSSPFRRRGADATVRGRSWAIHDGILGERFDDVKMFRVPGTPTSVATFPGGRY